MTWTIAETRRVPCAKCGAAPGVPCRLTGKGSQKRMRAGGSHQARIDAMIAARRAAKHRKGQKPAHLTTAVTVTGSHYRPPTPGEGIDVMDLF